MPTVRLATIEDVPQLLEIYSYYVENTAITFDTETPSLEEFEHKIGKIQQQHCCFVYEKDGEILGYAYGAEHRPKLAYQWTVESTVYVDHTTKSKGIGNALYRALLYTLEQQGFSKVLAGITLPNKQSINFHRKFGFTQFALFEVVGFKHNEWHDTDWWEVTLNNGKQPGALISIEQIAKRSDWQHYINEY